MADPAMIAVRFGLYAVLGVLFGLPLFSLMALRGGERMAGAALRWRGPLAAAAVAGLALSGLWLALLAASMGDTTIAGVTGETYGLMLSGTAIGAAWKVRMAALGLALLLVLFGGQAPRGALAGLVTAGGIALATLAWTGHGAMDEGARGWVHLGADILHLLAAGAWIGALGAFLGMVWRRGTDPVLAHRVLHGFASTGTVLVLVLLATGLVNGWLLVGPDNLFALPASDYGRLLIVKLALFLAMLGLAAANRYRLTPALSRAGGTPAAFAALRRSLASESGAALAILLLVGWMGLLSPPASGGAGVQRAGEDGGPAANALERHEHPPACDDRSYEGHDHEPDPHRHECDKPVG